MNFTGITIIFKFSNFFCTIIITTVILWYQLTITNLIVTVTQKFISQESFIASYLVALFIVFLKDKIVVIKETNFHKNKERYSSHNLKKKFEEKPIIAFFSFEKKMFFLLKRYHCSLMFIIFVARKEHHKRKYQWEILKPGQYNKKKVK